MAMLKCVWIAVDKFLDCADLLAVGEAFGLL